MVDPLFAAARHHTGGRPIREIVIVCDDGDEIRERPRPHHSPDFATVQWNGELHRLTPIQAELVRLLWDAWEAGTPEISQDYLLEQVGSKSNRLSDVFRQSGSLHPCWESMIVKGHGKGTFRMADLI